MHSLIGTSKQSHVSNHVIYDCYKTHHFHSKIVGRTVYGIWKLLMLIV